MIQPAAGTQSSCADGSKRGRQREAELAKQPAAKAHRSWGEGPPAPSGLIANRSSPTNLAHATIGEVGSVKIESCSLKTQ